MPTSTEVVRPVCTTVLVMPQADESLDSRRHVIYFRSQLTTQQFTLQFFRLRGEKQTPVIFILCFYKTLRQLNNTRNATSSYESLGSRRYVAFFVTSRVCPIFYFRFQ